MFKKLASHNVRGNTKAEHIVTVDVSFIPLQYSESNTLVPQLEDYGPLESGFPWPIDSRSSSIILEWGCPGPGIPYPRQSSGSVQRHLLASLLVISRVG